MVMMTTIAFNLNLVTEDGYVDWFRKTSFNIMVRVLKAGDRTWPENAIIDSWIEDGTWDNTSVRLCMCVCVCVCVCVVTHQFLWSK